MSVRAGTSIDEVRVASENITHPEVVEKRGGESGGLTLPNGPGSMETFFAAGGTIAQYMVLMGQYYAACHVACRTESSVASSVASAAISQKSSVKSNKSTRWMPWTRISDAKKKAMNDKPWRVLISKPISELVDAPTINRLEFFTRLQSKAHAVREAGDGFCYLYAIKPHYGALAAQMCGSRPVLKRLMQIPGDMFEEHAFLEALPVRLSRNEVDVNPVGKADVKFLSVCRAMSSIVNSPFMRTMDVYKPLSVGIDSVRKEGYRIGGPEIEKYMCYVGRSGGSRVFGGVDTDLTLQVAGEEKDSCDDAVLAPIRLVEESGEVVLTASTSIGDVTFSLGAVPERSMRHVVDVELRSGEGVVVSAPRVEHDWPDRLSVSGLFRCEVFVGDCPVRGTQAFAMAGEPRVRLCVSQTEDSHVYQGTCSFTPTGAKYVYGGIQVNANVRGESVAFVLPGHAITDPGGIQVRLEKGKILLG